METKLSPTIEPKPMTTNPIKRIPIKCQPEEESEMIEWSKKQPPHELDTCVNRACRWTFSATNHGIWTQVSVRDNGTGETFSPEVDVSNW